MSKLQHLARPIQRVLNMMEKANGQRKGMFKNKWAFVDTFYLIFQNLNTISNINPKDFADNFLAFETKRKANNNTPERLIDDKNSPDYDKEMYDYVMAFKTSGADKNNIATRNRVFTNYFLNSENFVLNDPQETH
jgi:hypothetical protein